MIFNQTNDLTEKNRQWFCLSSCHTHKTSRYLYMYMFYQLKPTQLQRVNNKGRQVCIFLQTCLVFFYINCIKLKRVYMYVNDTFFILYTFFCTYHVLACPCSGTSGLYFLYTLIRCILSKDSNMTKTSLYWKQNDVPIQDHIIIFLNLHQ